jgi:hypothetical protein
VPETGAALGVEIGVGWVLVLPELEAGAGGRFSDVRGGFAVGPDFSVGWCGGIGFFWVGFCPGSIGVIASICSTCFCGVSPSLLACQHDIMKVKSKYRLTYWHLKSNLNPLLPPLDLLGLLGQVGKVSHAILFLPLLA